jgi:Flp pilus assembly protein TadD
MDALRRAEAEKRAAAAREAPTLEEALPEHFDLRLEPEPERGNARAGSARSPRAHELERVLDMGSEDPTLADEFMLNPGPVPPAPDLATLGRPERVTPQTVFAAGRQPLMSRQTVGLAAAALLGVASLGILSWRMLGEPPAPPSLAPLAPTPAPARLGPGPESEGLTIPNTGSTPATSANAALPSGDTLPDGLSEASLVETPSTSLVDEAAPVNAPPIAAPPIAAPTAAPTAAESIVILRASPTATQANTRVEDAYAAWRRGDLVSARAGYEKVLATAPRSVDAHLGLGAIALREGQAAAARSHYLRALELAPGNAMATAAIVLIDAGEGDAKAAERLAQLPDAADPYVQFALGNHHARSGRWADAQRAYFAASKGDPGNADYAFNLAVSLDRLGQRAAARTWYDRALALHQPEHRFDPAVARARLATLETPSRSPHE